VVCDQHRPETRVNDPRLRAKRVDGHRGQRFEDALPGSEQHVHLAAGGAGLTCLDENRGGHRWVSPSRPPRQRRRARLFGLDEALSEGDRRRGHPGIARISVRRRMQTLVMGSTKNKGSAPPPFTPPGSVQDGVKSRAQDPGHRFHPDLAARWRVADVRGGDAGQMKPPEQATRPSGGGLEGRQHGAPASGALHVGQRGDRDLAAIEELLSRQTATQRPQE